MHLKSWFVLSALGFVASAVFASDSAPAQPSTPRTIFIVRHAEKSSPSGDVPLSDEGRARAAVLATMLQPAGVSAVFSSELRFAQETAAIVAQRFKIDPVVVPNRATAKLIAAGLPVG